ncbi:MAG: hypothetical protein HY331_03220 [Chloroflexi bacterium]|nr:hypothetical protein [Chloroflexota bacterium]
MVTQHAQPPGTSPMSERRAILAVGARFPAFVLPNQHGDPVDVLAARGDRRALVVVLRSASW